MRDLNTAAPGFFHQVQELWWDDMLDVSRVLWKLQNGVTSC
jgi:hypothetical protein